MNTMPAAAAAGEAQHISAFAMLLLGHDDQKLLVSKYHTIDNLPRLTALQPYSGVSSSLRTANT
jgi:hypothetical protein